MEKLNELRMTLIILLFGVFFISGCFFDKKYEVTFKTNGGSKVESISLKAGSTLEELEVPTKEGYEFKGWYIDGKPFDEDTKIESDITLVAKWEKKKIDYQEDEEEELESDKETTTTKVEDEEEVTTRKKKKTTTTKKKTTTTTKKSTTSTTTTTKPIVIDTTTTTTTEVITVLTTTTSSTTTTTTKEVDVTTIPTSQLIPETTTTTTRVVNINISKSEELKEEVNPETEETEQVKYENIKISFDVEDEMSNVESNIVVEDFEILINSDRKNWIIKSDTGFTYENIYDLEQESINEFNLLGNKEVTNVLSVFDGNKDYVFEYDSVVDKWFIKYPSVALGNGLEQSYYANIETALRLAEDGDTISLLSDITLDAPIVIDKLIHLDFNNKNVIVNSEYVIEYKGLNSVEDIFIKDLNAEVNNFMLINEGVVVNRIIVENSSITYSNTFKNECDIPIVLTNTTLSGLL